MEKLKRNPAWSREELILALELYLDHGLLDDKNNGVIELSNELRKLSAVEQNNPNVYRNPNGVAMKLGNFASLDPNYSGKGLSAGGKGDRTVWEEFVVNLPNLHAAAALIRTQLANVSVNNLVEVIESNAPQFDPTGIEDTRKRLVSAIVVRRGQSKFRRTLLNAYSAKCAITACDAIDALEAAHILGYMGNDSDHVSNGLLLRADLHTLFDLGLLSVDPATFSVRLADALLNTQYSELDGRALSLPIDSNHHPSKSALELHFRASKIAAN